MSDPYKARGLQHLLSTHCCHWASVCFRPIADTRFVADLTLGLGTVVHDYLADDWRTGNAMLAA
jgi:acetoacetate decarboxylase